MENVSILTEIAKSVGSEIAKSMTPYDAITSLFGEDGVLPILDKDIWVGSYLIRLNTRKK